MSFCIDETALSVLLGPKCLSSLTQNKTIECVKRVFYYLFNSLDLLSCLDLLIALCERSTAEVLKNCS